MSDIKSVLNPRDLKTLDAKVDDNWIPKQPRDLLLPYIEKDPIEEDKNLENRRKKAKEVYDGYGELIETSRKLKEEIAEKSKDVVVTLKPSTEKATMDAVKRVFGTDGAKITFQMYQTAIDKLAEFTNEALPKPGDKK